MHRIYTILLIAYSSSNLNAQSFSAGVAGIYGDDIKNGGVHARAYYNLKGNHICFGPEFSYFASKTERVGNEEVTKKLSEINFNIHYIFEIDEQEKWGIYPLIGANISFEKEQIDFLNRETETINETAFGVNAGFGIHRSIGSWVVFAEYDHLFSDLSQNSFLLGTFFTFGKKSEESE